MTTPPLTAKKLMIRLATALSILAVIMLVCSLTGTQDVSLTRVLAGPVRDMEINPDYLIFVKVRLPRVILAAIVGAALAGAGVVFQALLRNPLADPYILGISSGAGLGCVIAVISGVNFAVLNRSPTGFFAFTGALATTWLVWFIGRLAKKSHMTGLILAGVAVNCFFSALIMFLTSVSKSDQVYSTILWLMGNITEQDYIILYFSGGLVLAGIIGLFFISPELNALSFGAQDARGIGINPARTQIIAFAVAALITAIAVSLSGLVGFVGLVIPHTVRLVSGPDHRQLLPLSAVTGAGFLVAADTIARIMVAPAQLPVGVVTAIVGGPLFLLLLVKYTRRLGGFYK